MRVSFLLLTGILGLISGLQAESVIDTFSDPESGSRWIFSNGSEFPGATGSFQTCLDSVSKEGCGKLAIDLNHGGQYVMASRVISPTLPPTTTAITFQVSIPPGLTVALRVHDTSGQTLQYTSPRPLEYQAPNEYYTATFELGNPPQYFWGGAGNGIITGGISGIGILLTPMKYQDHTGKSIPAVTQGVLSMEHLSAVMSTALTLTGQEPLIGRVQGTAPNRNSLGVAIHFTNNPAALDAAAAMGAHFVRMDLFWSKVETTPGKYDFSGWDQLVSGAAERVLKTVLILDYGNPLYTGGDATEANHNPPTNAAEVTAFANFAKAAAQHFAGRGMTYEIWNEENTTNFWNPVSAQRYGALLKAASAAIRSGDSNALVVSGGLSETDFAYLKDLLGTGSLASLNAIGVHPYDKSGPEDEVDPLVYFQSLLAGNSATPKSLWITECGVSSAWYGQGNLIANLQTQAQLVLRQVLANWGAGRGMDAVYDLIDDGTSTSDPEQNFGFYSPNLSPKPAARTLQYLSRSVHDKTIQGFLRLSDTRAHALAFLGSTQRLFILWTELSKSITVTLPANATVTNMYGSPVTPGAENSITVSGSPQYVFVPVP